MDPGRQFSWTLAQSGKVSVSHQQLKGIVMDKVHIQCDCMTDSLLSDIAHADMQGDHLGRPEPDWLDTELQRTRVAAAPEPAKVPDKSRASKEKTHVMRVKSIQLRDGEVLLTEGQLSLQGEDVIVRDGISYFQGKSQLGLSGTSGPPILTGTQINRKRLEALVAKGGLHDLYLGNSGLLDGHRTLIQNPRIQFGSRVIPLEEITKQRSSAASIDESYLDKVLPNHQEFMNNLASKLPAAPQSAPRDVSESSELNKVLLLNGRCILKDNYIVILRGLLHVGGAWHRVIDGMLVGAGPKNSPHPVVIIGTPVYKDAADSEQMLLNNVTLSCLGSTVYAGNTPLLKDAALHADGAVLNICDLQRGSICGLEPPEDSEPARLFVQGGKFTLSDNSLDIFEGTVWFRDVKVQLPVDSTDEVRVKDSMIFVCPEYEDEGGRARVKSLFESRDIIYKDNMLLLDDLTPLLKGGVICHEGKERPLAWLSSNSQQAQSSQTQSSQPQSYQTQSSQPQSSQPQSSQPQSSQPQSSQLDPPSPPEPPCNRDSVLLKGTCIVDSSGIYVSKGVMIVRGKTVIIDKGIPLYSSELPVEDGSPQHQLEATPPRLVGEVVLDSDTARRMGAEFVKGAHVIKDARLDIRDGRVIMNKTVTVMADHKLVFDQRDFKPKELGVDPESETKEDSKESGLYSDQTESGWPLMVDNSEGGKRILQRLGPKPESIRPGARQLIQPGRTETEDSGRGISEGADAGHRGTDISPTNGAGFAAEHLDSLPSSRVPLGTDDGPKQSQKHESGRTHTTRTTQVSDGKVVQDGAERDGGHDKGFDFENEIACADESSETEMQGPNSSPRERNGRLLGSNGQHSPGTKGMSLGPTGVPLGLSASQKSNGALGPDGVPIGPSGVPLGLSNGPLRSNGAPLGPNGGSLGSKGWPQVPNDGSLLPNSAAQLMQAGLQHAHDESQGVPKQTLPLASLEMPSAGIRGIISVTARSPRQLVFSLQTRIEESLHFLDADN